ncbi:MAG: GTPase HflX [Myxococcales bacterium]|nr:GTPase HflX [Myxococcales bacterium]
MVGIRLPKTGKAEFEASLLELSRLAKTLGLEVIGQVTQRREALAVAAGLGEGSLRELAAWTGGSGVVPGYAAPGADRDTSDVVPNALPEKERARVVLVDHELTPRQTRNLELATGAEVLDRSMVVVSIFQRHAHSREARLQVEIARLSYLAPRLRESGAGEDRKRGGVGGKGVGESTLELGRRQIRDRIAELRRELSVVTRTSDTQRARRNEDQTVAIVGYTNAGKSSLMRRLSDNRVYVADQLFATLDTTVRALRPETTPRILVSDTVGFIKNLPHDLVASFRSTLKEAEEAQLLVHVVDASDPAFRDQLEVTRKVLSEIHADLGESLLVLNKRDQIDADQCKALRDEFPSAMLLSAHDDDDIRALHTRIVTFFERDMPEQEFVLPYSRQAHVAMLHASCRVIAEEHDEHGTRIRVRAPRAVLDRLARTFDETDRDPPERDAHEVSTE